MISAKIIGLIRFRIERVWRFGGLVMKMVFICGVGNELDWIGL